jgi:hypothetical protein
VRAQRDRPGDGDDDDLLHGGLRHGGAAGPARHRGASRRPTGSDRAPGRSIVAEDTTCNIELEIPEAGLSGPRSPSMFLSIDAAGSTEVAEANLLLDNYSEPIETSSGACFGEGLQVQCMDGVVTFTLRIDLLFQQRSDDTWTDRFQIDGEVTTITGSTPDDMREWFQFIQVNLLARLVEPIVRKL